MSARVWGLALVPLLLAGGGGAQNAESPIGALFLDRSYLHSRYPVDSLVFEGHIAPHLFFIQPRFGAGEDILAGPVSAWAISFTPMVRLRMFSTESHPVRTPSFMPRFRLQWFRMSMVNPAERYDGPVRVLALSVIPWGHHSNGQEGCLYADQSKNAQQQCVDGLRPPPAPRATNKVNGSFSTNYARAVIAYRNLSLDDDLAARNLCTLSLGAEVHPSSFGPGSIGEEQKALYPTFRLQPGLELARRIEPRRWPDGLLTLTGLAEYLRRPAAGVRPWAYTLELSQTMDALGGWGIFARYYDGMDYYNLGFQDEVRYLHFGILFDAFRPPEVVLPRSEPTRAPAARKPNLLDRLCAPALR